MCWKSKTENIAGSPVFMSEIMWMFNMSLKSIRRRGFGYHLRGQTKSYKHKKYFTHEYRGSYYQRGQNQSPKYKHSSLLRLTNILKSYISSPYRRGILLLGGSYYYGLRLLLHTLAAKTISYISGGNYCLHLRRQVLLA